MYTPIISLYFEDIEEFERDDTVSCSCLDCSYNENCECLLRYGASYDTYKRLINTGNEISPIIECSRFCNCNKTCQNRVVQLSSECKLEVFQTDSKGLGVRTQEFIPRGTYISEYLGELVSEDKDGPYVLQSREHTSSGVFITSYDATRIGNISRFFNHSCSPNMCVVPVRTHYILPNLAFFASRDINPYEELCFQYTQSSRHRPCYCNTTECKGFY